MAKTAPLKVPPSFTKALHMLRANDVTHIKVELEATLNRTRNTGTCGACHGRCYTDCANCAAHGYKMTDKGTVIECGECDGEGTSECVTCGGRGYSSGGSYSEDWCQNYIVRHVSSECAKAITYGKFYRDPSVDSEFTFTVPVLKSHYVVEVIHVFNQMALEIGNNINIENAGMHIALLPEGRYPCSAKFNERKMSNFRRETQKLLPALYFMATHTQYTRKLSFRKPQVSDDIKYSAVYTHGNRTVEYRIFDPCFDKPEAFYDKLEVIARTWEYYSDKKFNAKYNQFKMLDSLRHLSDMYGESDNYQALLATAEAVKPDKTMRSIRSERNFKITKPSITKQLKSVKQLASNEWDIVTERYNQQKQTALVHMTQWLREFAFNRVDPGSLTRRFHDLLYAETNGFDKKHIVALVASPDKLKELLEMDIAQNGGTWGAHKLVYGSKEEYIQSYLSENTKLFKRPNYILKPVMVGADTEREDRRINY